MAYSPPSSDAIDFSIESYTTPSSDAIDFTVGGSTDSGDTVTKTALVSGTTSPTTTVGTATTNIVGQTDSTTDPTTIVTGTETRDSSTTAITTVDIAEDLQTTVAATTGGTRATAAIVDGRIVSRDSLLATVGTPLTTVVGNEQRETLTESTTTQKTTTPALRVPLATVTSLSTESLSTVQTVSQIAALTGGQTSTTPFNILEITDNTVGKDDSTNVLYLRPSFTVEYDRDSTEVIYNND